MNQLKIVISRLKTPSVVISIASQVISVLVLLNINVDRGVITAVVTAGCSVLVLLGIMSNPDTVNKGYADDLYECSNCHEITAHVRVGDNLVCPNCGTVHSTVA